MEITQDQKTLFGRIGYLYLPAINVNETIEWYENKLGFKLKAPKFKDDIGFVAVLTPARRKCCITSCRNKGSYNSRFFTRWSPLSNFYVELSRP
ncbi:hypothetical protein [Lysinibacillus xylanilyticus]|uniref:hypothetical protein n=1 Tax=Lysinibacillus xylanilyticus TaxID=582475 RepID=UPI003803B3A0